ncbi:Gfo/Idh/MocA family protein [Salegentibacter sp. F14]
MENNRRKFLKNLGIAGATAAIVPSAFASEHRPMISLNRNEKVFGDKEIGIALIGAGGMGVSDAKTALRHDGIKMLAVCDLYDGRIDEAKKRWGDNIFVTRDYKEILKREDVDAVIIGTPDHWHKQISLDALKAGKHVYCEKPMIHSVEEGQDIIKAWKKSGKVYMVGSQGLSSLGNEKAKQLLAEGAIGEINYAEGFWARNSPLGAWQYPIPEDASPETVDWKRFIANTTKRPFDKERFFRWRNYRDYGTGMSGDLFVHLFSSLHFITDSLGPNKVAATGGLRYWKDGREVPDVLLGMFDYPENERHPGFNLSLRCNFVDGTSGSTYLKIVGNKGSMEVTWDDVLLKQNDLDDGIDPFLAEKAKEQSAAQNDRKKILPPSETFFQAEKGYKGAHYDHFANFFNAIRTNGSVVEDPVFGFRAAAPALLCNDSYRENTFINWDPVKMKRV